METKKIYFKDERMRNLFYFIKDKKVLDIGCYAEISDSDLGNAEKLDCWIHGFLKEHAKEVKGIDIRKDKIEILRKKGYDVYTQNAETFNFKEKFEVIIAGDVIEHLSNPGLFLEQAKKHLKKEGWLIITTPNVFCLNYKVGGFIRILNNDLSVHEEHTVFFSPTLIKNLLKRHGFEVKEMKFVNFCRPDSLKKMTQNVLCKIFGEKLKYNMMVFAKLKNNN